FNTELAAGSLDQKCFRHYILQDTAFLIAFGRALSLAAARAEKTGDIVKFAESAREALVVERALHDSYFEKFAITKEQAENVEPSPTCLNYNNFLIGTAYHAPYEVAVAALLPCFWIYREVGCHILERASPNNAYQAWIDTYADEEYGDAVREVIAIADRLGDHVSPGMLTTMHAAFKRAAQFEWMFWDAAWRLEDWPVP
ncbi:MAG: TenA family protein, partial [Acidiferrobacterales bacterium]